MDHDFVTIGREKISANMVISRVVTLRLTMQYSPLKKTQIVKIERIPFMYISLQGIGKLMYCDRVVMKSEQRKY